MHSMGSREVPRPGSEIKKAKRHVFFEDFEPAMMDFSKHAPLAEKMIDSFTVSPCLYYAMEDIIARLSSAEFQRLNKREMFAGKLSPGGRYLYTAKRTTLVACAVATNFLPSIGLTTVGGHTDSPNLKVKPRSALRRIALLVTFSLHAPLTEAFAPRPKICTSVPINQRDAKGAAVMIHPAFGDPHRRLLPASASAISDPSLSPSTRLFSVPPSRPQPRRKLKKRSRRRQRRAGGKGIYQQETVGAETGTGGSDDGRESTTEVQVRPLAKARAVEAGLDYWIDETDLQREREREITLQNRQLLEGEIPQHKLREEVVAPYKQNWIGWLSVGVVVLVTITKLEPGLLDSPVIPIPDL